MKLKVDILKQNKYKETSPLLTVDKIKSILCSLGISTEEHWFETNEIGTHSLRINVKGTTIGSNGKGMTKDYARASAYAEFIERLQNNKLQGNSTLTTILRSTKKGPYLYVNEKILTSQELAKECSSFVKMFAINHNINPNNVNKVSELLRTVQKMDYNILGQKDKFICLPYHSTKQDEIVYIPYFISNLHYGSNGMCAGNTRSEALVQGISEILERFVQAKVVMDQITLPDIPESYIKKYPYIYEMYKKIKESTNYSIIVKDCSFNGKYPVCALIISEVSTGKFGVKFGCHPDFTIALERIFTEATQGINLDKFSQKTKFDFYNNGVSNRLNLVNGYKTSDALYPYQLFSNESKYNFTEPKSVDGLNNNDLLDVFVDSLVDEGYDLLIHNVSFLDFPSYQIIVPGLSELNYPDLNYFESENTRFHVQPLLNQPKYITEENCKYVLSVIKFFKFNILENSMKDLSGILNNFSFPGSECGMGNYYFIAMCYAFLGKYNLAAQEIGNINYVIEHNNIKINSEFYLCMFSYLKGMNNLNNHNKVMLYLKKLFSKDICNKINNIMCERNKILIKQYKEYDFNLITKQLSNSKELFCNDTIEYYIFKDIFIKFKNAQI